MTSTPSENFENLGIAPKLLEVLTSLGFSTPTPIQHKAIPIAVEGKDIIGIAQTGTGKTLAFGVPMIQRLGELGGNGLVVLPTRELALQVDEVLQKIGGKLGMRTTLLIGGASMQLQHRSLSKKPHVVIATPGRLIDHLTQGTIKLDHVSVLVLDEADRMLDMGFAPQIKRILQSVPKERQTLLFSATMPADIIKIANQYMQLPLHIEIARAGTLSEQVEQELFMVHKEDKLRLLEKLIEEYKGSILVFLRTKHGAKKVCHVLNNMNQPAAELHSNRSLAQRQEAMRGFKSGKYRILVATDIAARGIDVTGIELVVNFDIPDDPGDYVHRIGRTGRAGATGKAITFVAPDQRGKLREIERLTRMTLSMSALPVLPPRRNVPVMPERQERRSVPREPRIRSIGNPRHNTRRPSSAPVSSERGEQFPPTRPSRIGRSSRAAGGSNRGRRPAGRPSGSGYGRPSGGRRFGR